MNMNFVGRSGDAYFFLFSVVFLAFRDEVSRFFFLDKLTSLSVYILRFISGSRCLGLVR